MKVLFLMFVALVLLALVVLPWAVRRQVMRYHAAQKKRKQQQHHHLIPTHTPAEGLPARR